MIHMNLLPGSGRRQHMDRCLAGCRLIFVFVLRQPEKVYFSFKKTEQSSNDINCYIALKHFFLLKFCR